MRLKLIHKIDPRAKVEENVEKANVTPKVDKKPVQPLISKFLSKDKKAPMKANTEGRVGQEVFSSLFFRFHVPQLRIKGFAFASVKLVFGSYPR
jgi:hypothetical protein